MLPLRVGTPAGSTVGVSGQRDFVHVSCQGGHGAYTCAELLRGFEAASGCTCVHNTRKTILLAAFGAGFGGALPSLEHCVQL